MTESDMDRFAEHMRRRIDASIEAIPAATRSRITQARYRALEQRQANQRQYWFWLPASAIASITMALLIFSMIPEKSVQEQTFIDEIDIISNLDLYENMEFYEWLEQHELPS